MLELNRTTFRRLVQIQIAAFSASFLIIVLEVFAEPFSSFDRSFETLVVGHFGPKLPESSMTLFGYLVFGFAVAWMIASSVGLLWFKRWARFGLWASLFVAVPTLLLIEGYRPSYTSPVTDWLTFIDAGLLGAILLLAYAQDYGTVWFARRSENTEQI